MISGHFNGFHGGHLDYIKQAMCISDYLTCVLTSDKQLLMKGGKLNQTECERKEILEFLIKVGYGEVVINIWDTETTLVAEALRYFRPAVFFRGYDKTLETMPAEERKVCEELGIKIINAQNRIGERHSSEIFDDS